MDQTRVRPGRNEPCHCGSGRKYKHCCLPKDESEERAALAKAAEEPPASPAEPETAPAAQVRPPKPQTAQPWKAHTSRGFVPRARSPRKVGGS